jgi:hypothetical protein
MRILIVDDHPVGALFTSESSAEILEASNGKTATVRTCRSIPTPPW